MQNNILPTTPAVKEKKQRKPRSKPIIDIIKIEEDASVKSDDDIIIDENANMEIINLVNFFNPDFVTGKKKLRLKRYEV